MKNTDRIIAELCGRHSSRFTGDIKLRIEAGEIVSVTESNYFDFPITTLTPSLTVSTLSHICKSDFWGNAIFRFDEGNLCSYGYIRTIKCAEVS